MIRSLFGWADQSRLISCFRVFKKKQTELSLNANHNCDGVITFDPLNFRRNCKTYYPCSCFDRMLQLDLSRRVPTPHITLSAVALEFIEMGKPKNMKSYMFILSSISPA